jgi:hypothetical protein
MEVNATRISITPQAAVLMIRWSLLCEIRAANPDCEQEMFLSQPPPKLRSRFEEKNPQTTEVFRVESLKSLLSSRV